LLEFAAIAAVVTITPGADMALVTRNALRGGVRAAFLTALGIVTGCMAWAAASALGIAAVIAASSTAFTVLKLAGAVYLVWLGLRSIARPAVSESDAPAAPGDFRQGLVTNLLNPKIAVFYSTLLPQFVGPGDPVLAKSLLLASIHGAMGVIWLSAYALVVTRAGDLLRRPRVRRVLDRVTGTVLIGLGVRLALERR
jgi:threonine/homoserine/homoserine lactone efflux protein